MTNDARGHVLHRSKITVDVINVFKFSASDAALKFFGSKDAPIPSFSTRAAVSG